MAELKPCPACGSKTATPVLEYDVNFPQLGYVRCRSLSCGLRTGLFADSGRHAVEIWNSLPRHDEVRGVGKWEMWEDYYGSNVYKCSVCGSDWDMIEGTPQDNDFKYCPNCGAKMEVSEDA